MLRPLALLGLLTLATLRATTFVPLPAGQIPPIDDLPARAIAPFSIAKTELTWAEWAPIRSWALAHGYDLGPGRAQGPAYPVSALTWYDAVKFCNAASELAGLTPAYSTDPTHRTPYRTGLLDLTPAHLHPRSDGYRLPTGDEWEYATRAGTTTLYSYGDQSDPVPANPHAWHTYSVARGDDVSPHPVALKLPNPFGLHDTAGNVAEWTFDLYAPYAPWRATRGGSVALDNDVTAAFRAPVHPTYRIYDLGLRLATTSPTPLPLTTLIAGKNLPLPAPAPLLPAYDPTTDATVATALVALLDPAHPANAPILRHHAAGRPTEALAAFRDSFLTHLRTLSGNTHRPAKLPPDLPAWLAETETYATTAKNAFDHLDNAGRAQPNSYHSPLTWDFGMGFSNHHHAWFDILNQYARSLPPDSPAYTALSPRSLANLVIYTATDDIAKPLKDPRSIVGNQQIEVAKILVRLARALPQARDAAAWETLGTHRLRTGALARYILPDGGDLEQSFNYNSMLPDLVDGIESLYPLPDRPDWVRSLRQSATYRSRLFASLRLATGTWPSVGNNNYGRDFPNPREPRGQGVDSADPVVARILDHLANPQAPSGPPPAFTSIAFPHSGYYLQRDTWDRATSATLFLKSSRPGAGHNHPDNNAIELAAYGRHLLTDREAPPYHEDHLPKDQRPDLPWVLDYKGEESPLASNLLLLDHAHPRAGYNPRGYQTTIPDQPWFTSPALDYVQGTVTRDYAPPRPIPLDEIHRLGAKLNRPPEETTRLATLAQTLNTTRQATPSFTARHTRQVIFLREARLWLLLDRATRPDGQPLQTLTQLWNLPAPAIPKRPLLATGFTPDQVQLDAPASRLLTNRPDDVNLALLHASLEPPAYTLHYGEKYPHRGWASLTASMVSALTPAIDLEATFPATGPVLTALIPLPPGRSLEQLVPATERSTDEHAVHLRLRLADGTQVHLAASRTGAPAPLRAGPATAHAAALLALTHPDGTTTGLLLDPAGLGHAYTLRDGTLHPDAPLTVPTAFHWQDTPAGLAPRYTP